MRVGCVACRVSKMEEGGGSVVAKGMGRWRSTGRAASPKGIPSGPTQVWSSWTERLLQLVPDSNMDESMRV